MSVVGERLVYETPVRQGEKLGRRRGVLLSVEGLWGAGKTTAAGLLCERIASQGFKAHVLHYGPEHEVIGQLSKMLTHRPLRQRTGVGGFAAPHHATVDVFLRLCREAFHHAQTYRPALEDSDVVILDHGVYSKLAYYLAVLGEHHPDRPAPELFAALCAVAEPWFLLPDRSFYLDVPWPLARERACRRASGGGNPASVERLLFLPRYDAAYRFVIRATSDRIDRVVVDARGIGDVVDELEERALTVLGMPARTGAAT